MSRLPRNLNGETFARHLERHWEYARVGQRGSHLKMRTESPARHTIIIPLHDAIRVGTLDSLVEKIAAHKGVTVEELLRGL